MGKEADEQLDDARSVNDIAGFDFDEDSESSEFFDLEGEHEAEADEEASEASPEGGSEAEGAPDEESEPKEELEAEGEPTEEEEGTPAEELPEEAADEGPFRIGDRTYDSWEQVEQAFKSALGQQARAAELERQNAELMVAIAGAKTQGEGADSEAQPKKAAEEKKGPLKLGDAVDPRVYRKLLEDPEVGAEGALAYVMEQTQKAIDSNNEYVRESLTKEMEPFVADSQQSEKFKELVGLFESVGNKVDENGDHLYPELLHDAGFVEACTTRLFNTKGLAEAPDEMAVYLTLLAEREWRKMQGIETDTGQVAETTAPGNGKNAAPPAEELDEEEEESVDGLDVVDDGGETRLPSKPKNESERVMSRIQRDLLDAETRIDPDIGFDF
jgi:hypothetical protein